MNYQDSFAAAYDKTLLLELDPNMQHRDFVDPFTKEEIDFIVKSSIDFFKSFGCLSSSDLAHQCIPLNIFLRNYLRERLSIESFITVGSVILNGEWVYGVASYEAITKELLKPDKENPLSIHTWLTLNDGSVLDCTLEGYLDVKLGRGEHRIDECMGFFSSGVTPSGDTYIPFLVGEDFLRKVGAFTVA